MLVYYFFLFTFLFSFAFHFPGGVIIHLYICLSLTILLLIRFWTDHIFSSTSICACVCVCACVVCSIEYALNGLKCRDVTWHCKIFLHSHFAGAFATSEQKIIFFLSQKYWFSMLFRVYFRLFSYDRLLLRSAV